MNALVVLFSLAAAAPVPAPEAPPPMCAHYENPIEEDHQWAESDFTYEHAKGAATRILAIVEGEYRPDWYELPNLYSLVTGFHLRRNAIEALEANDEERARYWVAEFCTFLTSRPVID